ncbi:rod shape-determining protein MreD [Kordiimonas sp. SCSIO 12603]|uniref:rod shape-determining protein MreD n=1 Tax=Kordiimonas sp. SCSIO 12603 TaxID=2829596 RepID=UPI002101DEBB|nr:rod shape-determining protein MreD [Kordiimonas sp. SCSIO 12603]UTW57864.1 rod shape-determining protein MreD [Kordiimonas sp. SCSIO 12603]
MNKMRSPMVASGPAGLLPVVSAFFLAILMLVPIGTGAANVVVPNLVLIAVFYWLSSRPLLMPYGACAILGFWLDLWLSVPLGLNMLILLLTRLFVLNQLKHYKGRNKLVHWIVFGLMSFGLYAVSWVIVSAVERSLIPVQPLLVQWLVTAFSYAPVAFLLGRVRRLVLR